MPTAQTKPARNKALFGHPETQINLGTANRRMSEKPRRSTALKLNMTAEI